MLLVLLNLTLVFFHYAGNGISLRAGLTLSLRSKSSKPSGATAEARLDLFIGDFEGSIGFGDPDLVRRSVTLTSRFESNRPRCS